MKKKLTKEQKIEIFRNLLENNNDFKEPQKQKVIKEFKKVLDNQQ